MLLRELTPDILPPRAALLSDDVVLLVLPDPEAAMETQPGIAPPYGTVAVHGAAGPYRIGAARLPGQGAGMDVLGADAAELAEDLDLPSARRLLGFLLGFCRTAFGLGAEPGFTAACIRLARRCAADAGAADPVATASPAWTLLAGVRAPAGAALYVLNAARVRHSPAAIAAAGPQLVTAVRPGDLVLALCDNPLAWTVRAARTPLPDALRSSGRNDTALRTACLRALQPVRGRAAALLRESQALSPALPRRHDDPASPLGAALEVALRDGQGGIFLRGWLRDPVNLVVAAEIRTPLGTAPIDPHRLHRVRRPDLGARFGTAAFRDDGARLGFVAHVPDPSAGLCAQPTLGFRLGSGAVLDVTAPLRHLPPAAARDAVLACVPPDEATGPLFDDCLVPAASALHRAAMADRPAIDVVRFGPPVPRPAVSIIVPLYRNLGFLRFQAAAFASCAECRRAELIYVLDSPEQRAETEHLLAGLHGIHGLSFTLAVMGRNAGYAAANNAAAALARAPLLLLLNSDVVPARPGWLAPLRAALAAPGVGAAGPKLLFDDGSIQHAGLFFQRGADGTWFNAHYHKGMPRHWPAALRRRRVPAVTGAALLVRRAVFEAVGGINEDYIIGDYEDSDFCLRVRATGAAIAYVPETELFHFERRSIQLHAGYTRTLAAAYNRRLHHLRWDGAITALMLQPREAA